MAATRSGMQAMRSISIPEAVEEYRTYNRAQNYSPYYVASTDRNLREFVDRLPPAGCDEYVSSSCKPKRYCVRT